MKRRLTRKIFEVGLRDGLQSENKILSCDEKLKIAKELLGSGLSDMEVGSFVKKEAIPQLANTKEFLEKLLEWRSTQKNLSTRLWAFAPNLRGLENALAAGAEGLSYIVAVSESFNKKNVRRTRKQLLEELKAFIKRANEEQVPHRVYLSTLVYCPYEGVIEASKVFDLAQELVACGVENIVLSDTTGHLLPHQLRVLLKGFEDASLIEKISLHLHDTRGLAIANVYEALNFSVTEFDASIGGLGGCPYAPGASGNLSSEDLCYFLNQSGFQSKLSLEKLVRAASFAEKALGKTLPSKQLRILSCTRDAEAS